MMKYCAACRLAFALLISALMISGCASIVTPNVNTQASALRAGEYRLDETHGAVLFRINHLGFSNFLGRFEKLTASLDFDADNPEQARIDALIEMNSLDIADDEFAQTLLGPKWFDAAQFPTARFTSTAITITGENTGLMRGDLTLHGVTKPVTFEVTFNGGARDLLRSAYVTGFSARGKIDRTDFGVSQFSGIITNEVELEIEVEFIKQ